MALETMIAYTAVLGLPLWLVVEEALHEFASGAKVPAAVAAATESDRRGSESVQPA